MYSWQYAGTHVTPERKEPGTHQAGTFVPVLSLRPNEPFSVSKQREHTGSFIYFKAVAAHGSLSSHT